MEIEGKVILDIGITTGTSKTGNPWKKRELVIETFGNYPRKVKLDIFGDRIDTMNLEVGKSYAISFDLESREWNQRWYTDVKAYAAREIGAPNMGGTPVQAGYPAQPAGFPTQTQATMPADPFAGGNESDDLPF